MATSLYLNWLSNNALFQAISHVYDAYSVALLNPGLKHLQRNVIDPFSIAFEAILYGKSAEECLKDESSRQAEKTLGKAVGDFHQIILGSCKGWVNLGTGDASRMDVKKVDNSVFAEIKNKSNTTNADSASAVFNKMKDLAVQYPKAYIYHVQIVRKSAKPYRKMWKTAGNKNPKLQLISGDLFYEEVTGVPNALAQLFKILPQALEDFVKQKGKIAKKESTVVAEIEKQIQKKPLERDDLLEYLFKYAYISRKQ